MTVARPSALPYVAAALVALALLLAAPKAAAQVSECARLFPGQTGETLVNQCNACRVVSVLRSRTGNSNPTQRSFTVYPGQPLDVPFKGPGRSRIVSDIPCEGTPGGAVNVVNPKPVAEAPPEPVCVNLYRAGGKILMANGCEICREVTVARAGQGGGEAKTSYTLKGKSQMPLEALGAASARLVGEARCAG